MTIPITNNDELSEIEIVVDKGEVSLRPGPSHDDLITKLADDAYAMQFRSLGEYRIELLKFARGGA